MILDMSNNPSSSRKSKPSTPRYTLRDLFDAESIIRRLLAAPEWRDQRPYDINNGNCEDFQRALIAAFPEAHERVTESYPGTERRPGHCWVYFRGRHYDAEAPRGVDRWQRLPIFRRQNRPL